jgi:type II secretory pathway component PulF
MTALTFEYTALDKAGAKRRAHTTASTKAEAYRKIATMGLTPLSIRPIAARRRTRLGSGRIHAKDLANFTYQLGVFVGARIPLAEGLIQIAQQERNPRFKDLVMDLAKRIQSGENLAVGMDSHKDALGEVYVETIRAAEKSGNLGRVLEHLSDMLEKGQEQARMVRSALMYPICVVTVLTIAVLFLCGFVVPKFAGMFAAKNLKLPLFTELLMGFGLSLQHYWWAYLIVMVGAGFGVRAAWLRPNGRAALDRLAHHIPYLKNILVGSTISRFSQIFALSLQSGLGLIDSLELAGKSAGRPLLARDVTKMVAQVRSGGRLMEVLGVCTYLTPFTKRMLTAGEQSAEIPKMCGVVSRHYDRETTHLTKNISTFIEPILIVAIAGVVLVIALAIFLPMWDMAKLVG